MYDEITIKGYEIFFLPFSPCFLDMTYRYSQDKTYKYILNYLSHNNHKNVLDISIPCNHHQQYTINNNCDKLFYIFFLYHNIYFSGHHTLSILRHLYIKSIRHQSLIFFLMLSQLVDRGRHNTKTNEQKQRETNEWKNNQ